MNETDRGNASPPPPSTLALTGAFAIIYFAWGTTYLATSIAMKQEQMPPALFGGIRLCVAGTILFLWQLVRGQSLRLSRGEALQLLLVSGFLFLGANLLINIGQQEVKSGVAAILVATIPLWMGLFGMLWPSEPRLSWRGWLGLCLGFAGIMVTLTEQLREGFQLFQEFRHLFILGSAASWAVGSLISRHLAFKIPHLTSACYQMLFGGACQVVIGTSIGEWQQVPQPLSLRTGGVFLYLVVCGSLAGFVAFNWLLGHVPAAKVGTYAYINPLIAVFIGWCVGETPVQPALIAGIAIILVGVYMVRGDQRPSREIELEPD